MMERQSNGVFGGRGLLARLAPDGIGGFEAALCLAVVVLFPALGGFVAGVSWASKPKHGSVCACCGEPWDGSSEFRCVPLCRDCRDYMGADKD